MEYNEEILAALAKAVPLPQDQTQEVDYHKFLVDITSAFAKPD